MDISELTLKLILILVPGGIASIIFERLTIHKEWSNFKFVVNSILLGGISYLIGSLLISEMKMVFDGLTSNEIPYEIILKVSGISIIVGLVAVPFDHYKVLNRFAKLIKISNKYGDENLFTNFLNSKEISEIYVRDFENNLVYHGFIEKFSEQGDLQELLLYNVKVYSENTSEYLYDTQRVYLSMHKKNLLIEVPHIGED